MNWVVQGKQILHHRQQVLRISPLHLLAERPLLHRRHLLPGKGNQTAEIIQG